MLMLFKSPKPIDSREAFSDAKMGNENVESQQQIKICGTQPAMFVKAEGVSNANGGKSKPLEIQMVVTTAGGNSYFAMYIYPQQATPNAQAVASLRELCPKPQ